MTTSRVWILLVAALLVNAMLVGAAWDQAIKQLPARRVIGVEAFSAYRQACLPSPQQCSRCCPGHDPPEPATRCS
jgi:hypothetical protein